MTGGMDGCGNGRDSDPPFPFITHFTPYSLTLDTKMSYNGIGLATVRGTATSGHVQYNAGHVRNSSRFHRTWRNANGGGGGRGDGGGRIEAPRNKLLSDEALREGANSIALHEKKRQLEIRLLELREQLEDGGTMKDTEIDEEVEWERKRTLDQWLKEEMGVEERKEQFLLLEQHQELESANDDNHHGEIVGARENVKLITATGNAKSDVVAHPPRQRRWDNPEIRCKIFDHGGGKLDNYNGGRRQSPPVGCGGGISQTNSQARQMELERRNDRLRDAFGINNEKHQEGEAFDRELQQTKKMEKQKKQELVEKAKRKEDRAAIREKRRDNKVKRKEEKRICGEVDNGGKKTKTKNNAMRNGRHSTRALSPSSSSSSDSYSSSSSSSGSSRNYSSSSRSDRSYSSSSYSDKSRRGRRGRAVKRSSYRRGRRTHSSSSRSSRSYSSGSYSSRSRSSDDDDDDKKLRASTRKGAATGSKDKASDILRRTSLGVNNSLSIPLSSSGKDYKVDKGVVSTRGTVSDINNGGRGGRSSRWGDKPASNKAMSHHPSPSPTRNLADEVGKQSKKRSLSPLLSRSPKYLSAHDGESDAKSVRRGDRRSPSYSRSPSRSSQLQSRSQSGSRNRSPSTSSSVEGDGRKARNHTQHKENRKSAPPSKSQSVSDSSSRQRRHMNKRGRGN